MANRTLAYLLGTLAGAVALMLVIRYKKGGKEFVLDAIDEVVVTVQRIGDALASLGDWTRKIPEYLRSVFANAGAAQGLPAGLLEAVAYRESRFRPDVINGTTKSSAGAIGIMQIVPKWHPELGAGGAADPLRAIPYAAQYLATLRRQFGTWALALAAYNWGPGNLQGNEYTPAKWPAETRTYVDEITRNAGIA